jgi:predicted RNA-binding protein
LEAEVVLGQRDLVMVDLAVALVVMVQTLSMEQVLLVKVTEEAVHLVEVLPAILLQGAAAVDIVRQV